MRDYVICITSVEESELAMSVLNSYDGVHNVKRKSAIAYYEMIRFKCKKNVWKQIKKELDLRVKDVFLEIKKD